MDIKNRMQVMTKDNGRGVVLVANRGGRHLVKFTNGQEYWELKSEVFPIMRKRRKWRNDPATDKQVRFMVDLGITIDDNLTKGKASDLIDMALEQRH